ncbi:MAG: isochorismate synthase [Allomuricauda sp.]
MFDKIAMALQNGLPFCSYRKPNDTVVTGVFQQDKTLVPADDFTGSGFVFAPFNKTSDAILIRPDEFLTVDVTPEITIENKPDEVSEEGKQNHLELVEKGIMEIKKGNLNKVVLSRKIEVETTKTPIALFQNMLAQYPTAFCYLFHHPKVGIWCGATPETLMAIDHGKLRTMSLAATMPVVGNSDPQWGAKEREEQQMVSDYIESNLLPLTESLQISQAKSVKAGSLWHLRSDVTGEMAEGITLSNVLHALHPTPAVCGIPKAPAMEFILNNEGYDRSFYTGFLGELNLKTQGEATFFVNLRCMELIGNKAHIFVGGGITEASDPESEWTETQNKSRTMLNIL